MVGLAQDDWRKRTLFPDAMELRKEMDRSNLHFTTAVHRHFDFLTSGFGFRTVGESELCVRYEAESVFVEVYHGSYDFEIGVNFGRLSHKERFDFAFFLKRFHSEVDQELSNHLADTTEKVDKVLEELAQLLRTYGVPIIKGENQIYERMTNVRWWHFYPEALKGRNN
jgi:hypothetical protein